MIKRLFIGAAVAVTFLSACGGGDDGPPPPPAPPPPSSPQLPNPATAPALKAILAAKYGQVNFPVGAAIEPASTTDATDSALLIRHFSSITAENVMKPDAIWPGLSSTVSGTPDFTRADILVNYAVNNQIQLRGHTLLWHQTVPAWMLAGDRTDPANYRTLIQQNLRNYIHAVIRHPAFANVYAWDVVNEVASDTPNASNPYRTNSPWYEAYSVGGLDGRDYVVDAFLFATQARTAIGKNSGNMKLMLNDYNTELSGKRANVIQIVRDVMNSGVGADINGVGHQFHLQLDADVAGVTAALAAVEAVSSTLVNHVTELDVSIYADPGTCFAQRTIPPCLPDLGASPPQSVLSQQALKYRELFNAFNRPSVQSVTLWGIADNHTWLNGFPVARTNRPLLFDTAGRPKWAFWTVVDPTINVP
jgi:endo-1,4-beta-xylanase